MQTKKNRSKRIGKIEKICRFREIKTKIQKAKKTDKGAKASEITSLLSCSPNFIGCFAENELSHIKLKSFPCFLIVNVDHTKLSGSHWISLYITQSTVEIWDTLGFRLLHWPRIPCVLLNFLHNLVVKRKVIVSRRIQSDTSVLCGFYCIFFVLCRPFIPFSNLMCHFDSKLTLNDSRLIKFFS